MNPQVIPEGAGPVKRCGWPPVLPPGQLPSRVEMGGRGQGSGEARPRSGRRAFDADPARRMLVRLVGLGGGTFSLLVGECASLKWPHLEP
jgi:hypothetical protein